jgi:hypothetical protein
VDAVVDQLDGSFTLNPKPEQVRRLRLIPLAIGLIDGVATVVVAILAVLFHQPGLLVPAAVLLVAAGTVPFVFRRFFKPPAVKADAMNVSCRSTGETVVVPRAELTMIFLGQVVQRARYTAWVQSYIFAVADGDVRFAVPALWFERGAIDEFARRLGVPVKGDFTQRVQGKVGERP